MKNPVNFSFYGALLALLTLIPASLAGLASVYARLCIPAMTEKCSSIPMSDNIVGIGYICFGIAILCAVAGVMLAIEGIAVMEKQRLAYGAIGLVFFYVMFFLSGLFEIIVLRFLS